MLPRSIFLLLIFGLCGGGIINSLAKADASGVTFPEGFARAKTPQTFPFRVRYLPSQKAFWIDELDVRSLPISAHQGKQTTVNIVRLPQREVVFSKTFEGSLYHWRNIKLAFTPKDGVYSVEAVISDRSGMEIARETGRTTSDFLDLRSGRYMVGGMLRNAHLEEYVKPYDLIQSEFLVQSYPFENFTLEQRVNPLSPFTDVEVHNTTIHVVGRQYQFNALALPEQVTISQKEPTVGREEASIFTEGAKLILEDSSGEQPFIGRSTPKLTAHSKRIATLTGNGEALGVGVSLQTDVEEDGVMRISVSLNPKKGKKIRRLSLQLSLRQEQATLFHEITDVCYRSTPFCKTGAGGARLGGHGGHLSSQLQERDVVWSSAWTEKKESHGNFQPMVWLGNEDRGFCWFSDSDRGWILDDAKPALTISRKPGRVVLEISFINKEVALERPLSFQFGLLATPVKPLPKGRRSWVYPRWSEIDWSFYEKLGNLRKIVMVGAGDPKFNAGVQSAPAKDPNVTRQQYQQLRQRFSKNDTFMEYWICDEQSMDAPELRTYFGEWCGTKGKGRHNHTYPGHTEAASSTLSIQRASQSYLKYKTWCLDEKLTQVGQISYYEDNAMQRVHNDPAQDLGYNRADGKRQPEFDIWSFRSYMRDMASVFAAHGKENLIGVHCSTAMLIPAFTYAAFAIEGEQPTRYSDNASRDALGLWNDRDYFRTLALGRQFGVVPIFLSLITTGDDPDGKLGRSLMALCLIHDVGIWDGAMPNRSAYRKWHSILNDFDFSKEEPDFFPYWGSIPPLQAPDPGILSTAWRIGDRVLMVVANVDDVPFDGNITVNPAVLPTDQTTTVKDAETGLPVDILRGDIKLAISRHDYRVLELRRNHSPTEE